MKISFFIISLFFISLFQESGEDGYILWNADRPLKWEDFSAPADMNSSHSAQTNSGISFAVEMINGEFLVDVRAQFDPSQSWKKPGIDAIKLLKHEQLHFDITELGARRLRKAIADENWSELDRITPRLKELYRINRTSSWQMQADYDAQTRHGLIELDQLKWEEMISDSLDFYSEYENTRISFSLND